MGARMANYHAIQIGENDPLVPNRDRMRRNRIFGLFVFLIFAVASFCMTVKLATPLLKPTTPLLSSDAQWSNCASFSLAECCDCGDQKLVAGQCWDGNVFEGMKTCKRGCCLAGLVDTFNPKDMMITAALMTAVGAGTAGLFFLAFGLGPLGPIAGRLFASLIAVAAAAAA